MPFLIAGLGVEDALIVTTVPSEKVARMTGSVTERIGGESMIMRSYWARARSMISFIFFEFKSSAGFGGSVPEVMTLRLGMSVFLINDSPPVRSADKPLFRSRSKTVWILGLRRSASIKSTFFPMVAKVMARLDARTVLPSRGSTDVIKSTFFSISGEEKRRLVLMVLKASAIVDLGSTWVIISFFFGPVELVEKLPTTPRSGIFK